MDVAVDIVIRIRPEAYGAAFAMLAADIDRLVVQLERWRAGEAERRLISLDIPAADPSNDS